jgi:DNA-binding MarR family transcriptional regulator
MVDNITTTTHDFLIDLGLSPEDATLYLTLIDKGPLSTLELARASRIPRSTVYRLLEGLKKHKLVEEVVDQHRTLASAVPPEKLALILQEKQASLQQIHSIFPQVSRYLSQQIEERRHPSQVKFYRGISGIQQMAWNELQAKDGIVGYTQSRFSKAVGEQFAQDFYEELFFNKIPMLDIYSDNYVESMGGLDKLGEVNKPFNKYFGSRYLPNDKLSIIHTMDIYNDVVAIYDWQGKDIFGTEIHNTKVAAFQKQIWQLLWDIATLESQLIKKAKKRPSSPPKNPK